ncbi:TetR/AcrR family transcriptional regulator [uncultured Alsobacter sp.]|uniref:TetR/AcrR family transcriptional regulator n=1 Tax=uncultured Alsobacter sp. TaxID=1748258 RepID=UPI0025CBA613|nr:TetR/AcrR family transcriptional regulator [uncultured Alsobacter sp.]
MAKTPGSKTPGSNTPGSKMPGSKREPKGRPETEAVSAGSAAPRASARDRIIDATLALAAEQDWDEVDLRAIAERAGVTLSEFRDAFPSKGAVLAGLSRRVDRIVLDGTGSELDGEPVRERLFDVMMRRLDALTPYKEGLRGIGASVRRDPLTLGALNQMAVNSMRFMLAAAGVDTSGPMGMVKVQGAVLIWGRVMDAWFHDEDPGLAKTMATLDRELRRGGQFVSGLNDLCKLASPLRAFFDRAAEGGRRFRERRRASPYDDRDPRDDDYATAV